MASTKKTVEWNGTKFMGLVVKAVDQAVGAGGTELQKSMKRVLGKPGPSKPGDPPGTQNNTIVKTILVQKTGFGKVGVGTGLNIGRWLEYGVPVIKPKNAKMLAVPLNRAAKRLYATKTKALQIGGRSSLRYADNLQLIKNKKGNLFLVEMTKKGERKKGGAVFSLRYTTSIKPRPWVRKSYLEAEQVIRDKITSEFKERVFKALMRSAKIREVPVEQ